MYILRMNLFINTDLLPIIVNQHNTIRFCERDRDGAVINFYNQQIAKEVFGIIIKKILAGKKFLNLDGIENKIEEILKEESNENSN